MLYLQMIETDEQKSKFEQLYIRYQNLMFSVANRILNNHADAEDAVHQAFLYLACNFEKVSEVECPRTRAYLIIITESRAIDLIRENRRISSEEIENLPSGINENSEKKNDLDMALARLSARHRDAIVLKYVYGYNTKEISEFYGCSYEAGRKILYRAKNKLLEALIQEGVEI